MPEPTKTRTEKEYVMAQRKAAEEWYRNGWTDGHHEMRLEVASPSVAEVAAAYPLPVEMRPLRVRLSDGAVCWYWDKSNVRFDHPSVVRLRKFKDAIPEHPTPDDFRQLARVLDGEMEPVPEGEQP